MGQRNFNPTSRKGFLETLAIGSVFSLIPSLSFGKSQSLVTFEEKVHWLELNNEVYGAKANHKGSIGGGKGYTKVIKEGNFVVTNFSELHNALSEAKWGDVIFLPGNVHIDLTTYIYIDKLVLGVPPGVTIASDRGYNNSE